jgi:hypothetical protein
LAFDGVERGSVVRQKPLWHSILCKQIPERLKGSLSPQIRQRSEAQAKAGAVVKNAEGFVTASPHPFEVHLPQFIGELPLKPAWLLNRSRGFPNKAVSLEDSICRSQTDGRTIWPELG